MQLRTLLAPVAVLAASVFIAPAAHAGEINGTGNPPGGKGLGASHAASVCAFSGLEDGDGMGFPGPGGAPPQNWGHVQQTLRDQGVPADVIASIRPGISCNPNTPAPEEP